MNRYGGLPGWQWRFMMNAGHYKGRVALGANRIGKSKQGAYECALAVTGRHPAHNFANSGEAWIVGLDYGMIRDIDQPLFEQFLLPKFRSKYYKKDGMWLIAGEDREWKLVFKSTEMGPDKFQGTGLDFIWFDEEPKNPELLFPECETRLTDKGGIWWMTSTPIRGTKWLKKLSERKDVYSTFAGMMQNPHMPLEEIEKLRSTFTEDEIAVRIDGEYIIFGGRPVFDRKIIREMIELAKKYYIPEFGILTRGA